MRIQTIKRAKKQGRDGIVVKGVREGLGGGAEFPSTTYVVFDEAQLVPAKGR